LKYSALRKHLLLILGLREFANLNARGYNRKDFIMATRRTGIGVQQGMALVLLSADQLNSLHYAACHILKDIGIFINTGWGLFTRPSYYKDWIMAAA
jgi:hypothetical protein